MSASDHSEPSARSAGRWADLELECLYDDASDPSELTVFAPESESLATEWITVDRSVAVALTGMA